MASSSAWIFGVAVHLGGDDDIAEGDILQPSRHPYQRALPIPASTSNTSQVRAADTKRPCSYRALPIGKCLRSDFPRQPLLQERIGSFEYRFPCALQAFTRKSSKW